MLYFQILPLSGRPTGNTSETPAHGFMHFAPFEVAEQSEILEEDEIGPYFGGEKEGARMFRGVQVENGWVIGTDNWCARVNDAGELLTRVVDGCFDGVKRYLYGPIVEVAITAKTFAAIQEFQKIS